MRRRKIFLVLMTAIVMISSSVVSFASTTDEAVMAGTEDNPAKAAVGKLLQVPEGTALNSNQVFTFKFEQQTSVDLKD